MKKSSYWNPYRLKLTMPLRQQPLRTTRCRSNLRPVLPFPLSAGEKGWLLHPHS